MAKVIVLLIIVGVFVIKKIANMGKVKKHNENTEALFKALERHTPEQIHEIAILWHEINKQVMEVKELKEKGQITEHQYRQWIAKLMVRQEKVEKQYGVNSKQMADYYTLWSTDWDSLPGNK